MGHLLNSITISNSYITGTVHMQKLCLHTLILVYKVLLCKHTALFCFGVTSQA